METIWDTKRFSLDIIHCFHIIDLFIEIGGSDCISLLWNRLRVPEVVSIVKRSNFRKLFVSISVSFLSFGTFFKEFSQFRVGFFSWSCIIENLSKSIFFILTKFNIAEFSFKLFDLLFGISCKLNVINLVFRISWLNSILVLSTLLFFFFVTAFHN